MNKVEICGVNTSSLETLSEDKKKELLRRSAAGDEAGFPKSFEVLTSMDGKEYVSFTTVTDAVATADGWEVALNGTEARFVKIVTKELQPATAERGCYFALGEIEVYADVDTAANAILNRNDAWLYVNPNIPMQLEVLYNRDGSAVSSGWKYMTTNPEVAQPMYSSMLWIFSVDLGSRSLLEGFLSTIRATPPLNFSPMVVDPFLTASRAYSTWKSLPSGEKTVIPLS